MGSEIKEGELELPDGEIIGIENTANPDSETLENDDIANATSLRASGIISAADRQEIMSGVITSVPQPEVTKRFVSRIAEKMKQTIGNLSEENDIPPQERKKLETIMENLGEIEQINEPAYPKANPKVLNPGLEPIRLLAIKAIQVIKLLNKKEKIPINVDAYFMRTFDEWLQKTKEQMEEENRETEIFYLAQQLILGEIDPDELPEDKLSTILEMIEREEGEDVSEFLELFGMTDAELEEVSDPDMIPKAAIVLDIRENTRANRVFSE